MGIRQVLPLPGPAYEQSYMAQLVRALGSYIEAMANPGPVVCSDLRILQCPTSGTGLPEGSVWTRNGVLYIVSASTAFPTGLKGTSALGSVTVTTV